jgi:hypothetical protein
MACAAQIAAIIAWQATVRDVLETAADALVNRVASMGLQVS